jgi:hypothetical protein
MLRERARPPGAVVHVLAADDRLAVIWSQLIQDTKCPSEALEQVIVRSLQRFGYPYETVFQDLIKQPTPEPANSIFAY